MQKTKSRPAGDDVAGLDTFKTLLVHAEPGLAASHRIEAAGRLARDLGAHLIGVGATTYDPLIVSESVVYSDLLAAQKSQVEKDIAAAETAFRRDAGGADLEWRTLQDYPHVALNRLARGADLVVVSPRRDVSATQAVDPADVVMGAGRPVLIVPPGQHRLHAKAVVVAWKDTRECRRALADSLPILRRAEDVIIVTVRSPASVDVAVFETDDVVANLARHGVKARSLVTAFTPQGVTAELQRAAEANKADLIVCGAFGHSRLREWAFGGVTDDLLHRPPCFVLMSH